MPVEALGPIRSVAVLSGAPYGIRTAKFSCLHTTSPLSVVCFCYGAEITGNYARRSRGHFWHVGDTVAFAFYILSSVLHSYRSTVDLFRRFI